MGALFLDGSSRGLPDLDTVNIFWIEEKEPRYA